MRKNPLVLNNTFIQEHKGSDGPKLIRNWVSLINT